MTDGSAFTGGPRLNAPGVPCKIRGELSLCLRRAHLDARATH